MIAQQKSEKMKKLGQKLGKCQKLKKFEKILVPSIFRDTWDFTVITLDISAE